MPSIWSMRRSVITRSGRTRAERSERGGGAFDRVDLVVFGTQTDREQPKQPRIVVND